MISRLDEISKDLHELKFVQSVQQNGHTLRLA
jgi:hypothetical protein